MHPQIVPKAATEDIDWLDISDPRSKEQSTPLTQEYKSDINDAFDSITLNCFDEYAKPKEDPKSSIQAKKEHPYKSKKNKGKGKK